MSLEKINQQLRKPIQMITNINMGGYKSKVEYIVIHWVGAVGQAVDNGRYFKDVYREASAELFIDQNVTVQVVPENRVAWHVGDGLGKYGIRNDNAIGIELCLDVTTSDNLWKMEVHPNTYQQAILLVASLMQKYGVGLNRVVRHYDASRKLCPGMWMENNWQQWWQFKKDLEQFISGNPPKDSTQISDNNISDGKGSQVKGMYLIKQGDTLSKIAKDHKVSVNDLIKWNKIENANLIFPDTKIFVTEPKKDNSFENIHKQGAFRFSETVNIRNQAGAWGDIPDRYYKGEVVNYEDFVVKDKMIWLKYTSHDGKTRYISAGTKEKPFGKFIA